MQHIWRLMGLFLPCCCEPTPTCGMCTHNRCCHSDAPNNYNDAFGSFDCESGLTTFLSLWHLMMLRFKVTGCLLWVAMQFYFSLFQASSLLRPPLALPLASSPAPSCWEYMLTLTSIPKVRGKTGEHRRTVNLPELCETRGPFESLFWVEGEDFLRAPVTDWGDIAVCPSVKNATTISRGTTIKTRVLTQSGRLFEL